MTETTRITAGAFLSYGDKVLMMKRGLHKELGAGMWAGIGGHLDISDIKNPKAIDLAETCYREIQEEANIAKHKIIDLKLKYISTSKEGNDIRLHYHFFGTLTHEVSLPQCTEGEFHWVEKSKIPDLPMSPSVNEVTKHWIQNPNTDELFLVAVAPSSDSAVISPI